MRVLEFLKQDLDDPIKFASLVRRQMVKFGFHCVDVSAQVKGKRDGSSSQGLKITAPLWRVSFTLRVTRKRSCSIAVAARKVSMTGGACRVLRLTRSEEHTSELQSLMRISYAVFCLKKKKQKDENNTT